jgi:hypothetical protein
MSESYDHQWGAVKENRVTEGIHLANMLEHLGCLFLLLSHSLGLLLFFFLLLV